jgi:hypothetical protein
MELIIAGSACGDGERGEDDEDSRDFTFRLTVDLRRLDWKKFERGRPGRRAKVLHASPDEGALT